MIPNYSWIITMHAQRGFTLIELLIVLTIIAIMAGVGVPGFPQSRKCRVLTGL